MTNIIAIRCPNCGNWFKYYPLGLEEDIKFLGTETDCWGCKKLYKPCHSAVVMDDFIFDAFHNCKM